MCIYVVPFCNYLYTNTLLECDTNTALICALVYFYQFVHNLKCRVKKYRNTVGSWKVFGFVFFVKYI